MKRKKEDCVNDMEDFIENTLPEIEKTYGNLLPKHIGNGIYIINDIGIMCNEKFIEDLNNAILEDVKDKDDNVKENNQKQKKLQ